MPSDALFNVERKLRESALEYARVESVPRDPTPLIEAKRKQLREAALAYAEIVQAIDEQTEIE